MAGSETDQVTTGRPASVLEGWLTRAELAAELHVSESTIKRWDTRRTGPPYTQVGVRRYYSIEGVRKWMHEKEVGVRESYSRAGMQQWMRDRESGGGSK